MAQLITGGTANEVWSNAAELLLNQTDTLNGRTGEFYELAHTLAVIEDPKQRWVFSRIPPMSIGYALAELVWIMNGEDRADIINTWNPALEKFAGKSDFYHGAYGNRIRVHFQFDQLEKAYQALHFIPESRQVVIQIYDTKVDFPINQGQPADEDIPCNVCSMLKIRKEKLEWSQIMRSNDLLLGMPYNFVQFTSIQEIIAGWLKIDVGSYNHYSDSLHLYGCDMSKIGIGSMADVKNSDTLALDKDDSEKIFTDMYERMKALSLLDIVEKAVNSLAQLGSEYESYNNIMLVIAAYIAHKHKFNDLTKELVKKCSNNIYTTMWNSWVNK